MSATALYTSIESTPVDINQLCNTLGAISDINEGLRKFCEGIMDGTLHIEDAASMHIILAALDATQKRLSAVYPEVTVGAS